MKNRLYPEKNGVPYSRTKGGSSRVNSTFGLAAETRQLHRLTALLLNDPAYLTGQFNPKPTQFRTGWGDATGWDCHKRPCWPGSGIDSV